MDDPRINAAILLTHVPLGLWEMNAAFQITTSTGTGTCFLNSDRKGYCFLTASHLVEGVHSGDTVYLGHQDGLVPWTIRAIHHSPTGHDIAAFTVDMKVVAPKFEPLDPPGLMPGQPMKFLGYPHGLQTNFPNPNGYLSPLVRTAFFSGIIEVEGKSILVLDGFNNPGYSGGPVFTTNDQGFPQLFGVISGFRFEKPELGSVYRKSGNKIEKHEDFFVNLNSGMIYAVGIGEIQDLLDSMDDRLTDGQLAGDQ